MPAASVTAAAALVVVATTGLAGPPQSVLDSAAPPAGASAPAGVNADLALQRTKGISASALRLGRQTLAANDGWASAGTGTTGGAAADAAHIAVAHTRSELITALGGDALNNGLNTTPKIVFVSGTIDMSVDANDEPVGCDAFADPAYSLEGFLNTYDPAVWGTAAKPTGALEEARVRSAKKQGDTIKLNVGSNTTLVGINGGRIVHGSTILNAVSNVIIRNLEFSDAADCFPAWDPTDGSLGNWNSLYDLVSLTYGAQNVWIDHNSFNDGINPDSDQPVYFGRPYQVHDGATDFIRGSDYITVSWNSYSNHDKTMLIGSTDTPGVDVGKLRVTIHHNRFANVLQRAPRLRFGQADVYNNLYSATDENYHYSFGVGFESSIYAENNFFKLGSNINLGTVVGNYKGTKITVIGSLVQVDKAAPQPVDLVAAYNAAFDPDLATDAGWTPTLRAGKVDATRSVPRIVSAGAGAHRLGC
jgi:pectate lyase